MTVLTNAIEEYHMLKAMPSIDEKELDRAIKISTLQAQLTYAKELRLNAMVDRIESELGELGVKRTERRFPTFITPRSIDQLHVLTTEELAVWKAFLPTTYSGDNLCCYNTEIIPFTVLEEWAAWKHTKTFEAYEIWTPELPQDPILIGRREGIWYLLGQWAEADERMLTFGEIIETVKRRIGRMNFFKHGILWMLAVGVAGFALKQYSPHVISSLLLGLGIVGFVFLGFGYLLTPVPHLLRRAEKALIALGR